MKWIVRFSATVLLSGCGGVVCENPASDAATTKLDERLIGFWKVDSKASGIKDDPAKDDEGLFVVGKQPEAEGSLALAMVSLDKGVLKVERGLMKATLIEARPYVSLRGSPEADGKSEGWCVLRYDVPEAGTLRVLGMNEDEVAKDVRSGKVPGSVSDPKPGTVGESRLVTLSATVEALRAYLASHGDAVFKADKPLILKRIDLH